MIGDRGKIRFDGAIPVFKDAAISAFADPSAVLFSHNTFQPKSGQSVTSLILLHS
jgi:hypothetical protein